MSWPHEQGGNIVTRGSILLSLIFSTLILSIPQANAQELEEIVVTAQRRAQDLSDVAIAVNAFGVDDIQDLGYVDVTQVAHQTPPDLANKVLGA